MSYGPSMEILIGIVIGVVLTFVVIVRVGKSSNTSQVEDAGAAPAVAADGEVLAPAPAHDRVLAPRRTVPDRTPVRLSSDGRLSVVGESHYQPALRAIVGNRDAFGFENAVSATAVLVPEPRNRHDRNAVRVDIDGRTVGYIAREHAVRYQPLLLDLDKSGRYGECPAHICCGDDRIYGVWLRISTPDRLLPVNSADGLHLLQADRQVVVTGEERHQDVLAEVAALGRGAEVVSLFASLAVCEVAKGKYKGESGIEVLIDGRRVGELTKLQADRYVGVVQDLLARGLTPGCDATVRYGDKGWQVELQLPTPS